MLGPNPTFPPKFSIRRLAAAISSALYPLNTFSMSAIDFFLDVFVSTIPSGGTTLFSISCNFFRVSTTNWWPCLVEAHLACIPTFNIASFKLPYFITTFVPFEFASTKNVSPLSANLPPLGNKVFWRKL